MSPQPHVLAIPYPAQGHVIPLLEVAQRLTKHGLRVTFVCTDFTRNRVVAAAENMDFLGDMISLVSIPDGLGPDEDRNDLGRLTEGMYSVMPGKLEELIEEINKRDEDRITCMLADVSFSWPIEVAMKLKLPKAVFWPASAALLGLGIAVPKLISDGIISDSGIPTPEHETFQLAPHLPEMTAKNLVWMCMGGSAPQRDVLNCMVQNGRAAKLADRAICNSSRALELGALDFIPKMKPIGPLLAHDRLGKSAGYFWAEDSTCLEWLDDQPPQSVVYIAFGSFTIFDPTQFQELALGLELMGQPFLWVVRPDITEQAYDPYPEGFTDRVSGRGKMVGWAPQQRVLSHPSVACFLSHCGWNSTMEAASNGVPLLCWPYFADQFVNENYVCDEWKTGLRFDRDSKGIVTRDEIRLKIDRLLGGREFKERARDLKERLEDGVREGGESQRNFGDFVDWIKTL